jgi:hypothetical protein
VAGVFAAAFADATVCDCDDDDDDELEVVVVPPPPEPVDDGPQATTAISTAGSSFMARYY